ncbi:uncharacterized protein V1518DRAFT_63951 [Limtongia smithiae]|uniref:uncharacterized protein n=1 Tax=Limtongia smithiae TaxID=1125753 RepID=UPI0034CDBD19
MTLSPTAVSLRILLDAHHITVPYNSSPPSRLSSSSPSSVDKHDTSPKLKITGTILIDPSTTRVHFPFELKRLDLDFTSRAFCASINNQAECHAVAEVFSHTVSLLHENLARSNNITIAKDGRTRLATGPASIRFCIAVPEWLPLTLHTPHAQIIHTLSATLKYTSHAPHVTTKVSFRSPPRYTASTTLEIPFRSSADTVSGGGSGGILAYSNSKSSDTEFWWKACAPRATRIGANISSVHFRYRITAVRDDRRLWVERIVVDLAQERTQRFGISENSAWKPVCREPLTQTLLALDCSSKQTHTEYPVPHPFELTFPPPPPAAVAEVNDTVMETLYSFRICYSLRDAMDLLPSCNTPFLKVRHKVRIRVYLRCAVNPTYEEVYTVHIPTSITNAEPSPSPPSPASSLTGRLPTSSPPPPTALSDEDTFAELIMPSRGDDADDDDDALPTYDDAMYENQIIFVRGPISRATSPRLEQNDDDDTTISAPIVAAVHGPCPAARSSRATNFMQAAGTAIQVCS